MDLSRMGLDVFNRLETEFQWLLGSHPETSGREPGKMGKAHGDGPWGGLIYSSTHLRFSVCGPRSDSLVFGLVLRFAFKKEPDWLFYETGRSHFPFDIPPQFPYNTFY